MALSKRALLPDHNATLELGRRLGAALGDRALICLNGPLGAGKTTFVQGLAKGLSVTELVSSPTFTMLNEYHTGRLPLYHFDFYRLSEEKDKISKDMLITELDELLGLKGCVVIEWAELLNGDRSSAASYLNEYDSLLLELSYTESDSAEDAGRIAKLTSKGPRSEALLLSACDYLPLSEGA